MQRSTSFFLSVLALSLTMWSQLASAQGSSPMGGLEPNLELPSSSVELPGSSGGGLEPGVGFPSPEPPMPTIPDIQNRGPASVPDIDEGDMVPRGVTPRPDCAQHPNHWLCQIENNQQ